MAQGQMCKMVQVEVCKYVGKGGGVKMAQMQGCKMVQGMGVKQHTNMWCKNGTRLRGENGKSEEVQKQHNGKGVKMAARRGVKWYNGGKNGTRVKCKQHKCRAVKWHKECGL